MVSTTIIFFGRKQTRLFNKKKNWECIGIFAQPGETVLALVDQKVKERQDLMNPAGFCKDIL